MRRALLWSTAALLAATWATRAAGQTEKTTDSLAARDSGSSAARDSARKILRLARENPSFLPLPALDSFAVGGLAIGAGKRLAGQASVINGTLDVYGTVDGNALALNGNIVVHRGGTITGDARAVLGQVLLDGGQVRGEMRSVQGRLAPRPVTETRISPTAVAWRDVKLAFGWFAVLGVIGIGVLVFGSSRLDGVVATLERDFSRSFWVGLSAELALAPALLLLLLALALTILGVLLIPFAIVAYAIAAAGMLTLGFLAMSQVTGRSLAGANTVRSLSQRGAALRGLVVGLLVFLLLWVAAGAFSWQPLMGAILRGIALAVTFAAVTAGFGATVLSRAGTRGAPAAAPEAPLPSEELSWQTPTPVSGVVAARRPTPAPMATRER